MAQAPPSGHFCKDIVPSSELPLVQADGGFEEPVRQVLQAAWLKGKEWKQGQTIVIKFLEGTEDQKKLVRRVVDENFAPLINLKLEWQDEEYTGDAQIRVTFDPSNGAWSYLGTDALDVTDQAEATLNLGWLDLPGEVEESKNRGCCYGVVLHEFGHGLGGWIHEHQNPIDNPLPEIWNMDVIIKDLSGGPNFWDAETIEANMFETYSVSQVRGTAYDPKSIAHYFYPATWVKTGEALLGNQNLSDKDKLALSMEYPRANNVPSPLSDPYAESSNQSVTQSQLQLQALSLGSTGSATSLAPLDVTVPPCQGGTLAQNPAVLTFIIIGTLALLVGAGILIYANFKKRKS